MLLLLHNVICKKNNTLINDLNNIMKSHILNNRLDYKNLGN